MRRRAGGGGPGDGRGSLQRGVFAVPGRDASASPGGQQGQSENWLRELQFGAAVLAVAARVRNVSRRSKQSVCRATSGRGKYSRHGIRRAVDRDAWVAHNQGAFEGPDEE